MKSRSEFCKLWKLKEVEKQEVQSRLCDWQRVVKWMVRVMRLKCLLLWRWNCEWTVYVMVLKVTMYLCFCFLMCVQGVWSFDHVPWCLHFQLSIVMGVDLDPGILIEEIYYICIVVRHWGLFSVHSRHKIAALWLTKFYQECGYLS